MSQYRQHVTSFTSAPIIVDSPVTGSQSDRAFAVPEGVSKLRIPAESGGLFVKWGEDGTVDAQGDETDDFYVPWGGLETVAVPAGTTHVSVISLADSDWLVVIQGVN